MKTNLHDYSYFSKTQRNGFFALVCIILLIFFLCNSWLIAPDKTTTDFSEFEEDIAVFESAKNNNIPKSYEEVTSKKIVPSSSNSAPELFEFNPNTVSKEELIRLGISSSVATTFIKYRNTGAKFYKKEDLKKIYGIKAADYKRLEPYINIPKKKPSTKKPTKVLEKSKPKPKQLTPFDFNPNIATKETLLELGLSPKIAQTVLNFRSKGGKFWKKEDFKRIYGLTEKDYATLAPFINIPKEEFKKVKKIASLENIPKEFATTDLIKIDINNSSVEDWQKLNGVGEFTAKRIVNFRDKLGGYTSIEHIKETWNVPDSVIDKIAHQLIESPIVNKIPINSITADELKLHPYVKRKEAYVIVNFRTNHGNYANIEDLKKVGALTPFFIERITPYLSFE